MNKHALVLKHSTKSIFSAQTTVAVRILHGCVLKKYPKVWPYRLQHRIESDMILTDSYSHSWLFVQHYFERRYISAVSLGAMGELLTVNTIHRTKFTNSARRQVIRA